MSSNIVKRRDELSDKIKGYAPELAKVLPPGLTPQHLQRVAVTAMTRNPDIVKKCTERSIIGAVFTCAQLGLVPDSVRNEAHFVPFGKECQLIIGYKGLEQLCVNSGKVQYMVSRAVFENDTYSFEYTDEGEKLRHVPAQGDRGEFVAAYDIATMTNGDKTIHWMWKEEIDEHKNRSKMGRKNAGPWKLDYIKMAMKTVKREHAKQLPMSARVQTAVHLDELAESDHPQGLEANIPEDAEWEDLSDEKSTDYEFFKQVKQLRRDWGAQVGHDTAEERYYGYLNNTLKVQHMDELQHHEDKERLLDWLKGNIVENKLLTIVETDPITMKSINDMMKVLGESGYGDFADGIKSEENFKQMIRDEDYKKACWHIYSLWAGGDSSE